MEKANNPLSLGSATYAAKRAADIIVILQNKDNLDNAKLVLQLNKTLQGYGEKNEVTNADLKNLRLVAQGLLAVFSTSDTKKAVSLLNGLLQEYAGAPRLSDHGGSLWHIHVDSSDHAPWAEWLASSSALALAILLAEKQRNPGGLCASLSCGRPFIDLGKGGGRSYCSPRCATRERVSAYRKRTT
ncbi:MAG TPA: CGNR zinc finger domain-containing protein [Candidatus Saccharimonadales bacterium]|nr:CGNR zinc finger domain-containing protein [Candidatus Saccharimonadales bacterium]